MQKKKLTKKQRKAQRTPNDMVEYSMRLGDRIDLSDRSYRGKDPVYMETPMGYRKVRKGVPYVRVR